MNANAVQTLITDNITIFSASALVILGAIIGLGVGFVLFRMGWKGIERLAFVDSAFEKARGRGWISRKTLSRHKERTGYADL